MINNNILLLASPRVQFLQDTSKTTATVTSDSNIQGRKISSNLTESISQRRRSRNTKNFPLSVEIVDKRQVKLNNFFEHNNLSYNNQSTNSIFIPEIKKKFNRENRTYTQNNTISTKESLIEKGKQPKIKKQKNISLAYQMQSPSKKYAKSNNKSTNKKTSEFGSNLQKKSFNVGNSIKVKKKVVISKSQIEKKYISNAQEQENVQYEYDLYQLFTNKSVNQTKQSFLKTEERQKELKEKNQQKQAKLQTINQNIRDFNTVSNQKYKLNSQELQRRLPWGSNQERLKNYAISIIEKMYKQMQYSQQYQRKKIDIQTRRQQIGLDNIHEQSIQKLIQRDKDKSKEKPVEIPKKEENIAKKYDVYVFMQYKKQQQEKLLQTQKHFQQQEEQRKKENIQQLHQKLKYIANSQKKTPNKQQKPLQLKLKTQNNNQTSDIINASRKIKTESNTKSINPHFSEDFSALYDKFKQIMNESLSKETLKITSSVTLSAQRKHKFKTSPSQKQKKKAKPTIPQETTFFNSETDIQATKQKFQQISQRLFEIKRTKQQETKFLLQKVLPPILEVPLKPKISWNFMEQQVLLNNQSSLVEQPEQSIQNNNLVSEQHFQSLSKSSLEEIAEELFDNAAVTIQKIWRGFFTRKVFSYYMEMLEKNEIDEEGNIIECKEENWKQVGDLLRAMEGFEEEEQKNEVYEILEGLCEENKKKFVEMMGMFGDGLGSKEFFENVMKVFGGKNNLGFIKQISSKNNSSLRDKSHSLNYEMQSEKSFNELIKYKFNSPQTKQSKQINIFSIESNEKLDSATQKEELNQLYALLQQDQLIQKKIIKGSQSSKFQSKEILHQEMLNEYFKTEQKQPTNIIFQKDSFQEFTDEKFKQVLSEDNINEILKLRQQALEMRCESQINAMNKMLIDNSVSPKTYKHKKTQLEIWAKQQQEEILKTKKVLQTGLIKAMQSIKSTKRDLLLAQRYQLNPSKLDSKNSSISDEEYLFRKKEISIKSDSDTFSEQLSSSQGFRANFMDTQTPKMKNNIQIIDRLEILVNTNSREKEKKEGSVQKSRNSIQDVKEEKDIDGMTLDNGKEEKQSLQAKIASNEDAAKNSKMEEMIERNQIIQSMKEKWRILHQIDQRMKEQLQKESSLDKSEFYGISTCLNVIITYMDSLYNYILTNQKQSFISNLNSPFGFSPQKRLKLIHGYDSFIDVSTSEENQDFNTLPFVLSEELFIEFEQNIIGNGETEKEQIIKEFQHIHNKAIFDTFNEALNVFRPYYALGGQPYLWSHCERNLIFNTQTEQQLPKILQKSKKRVVQWGKVLCGLINDEEVSKSIPFTDQNGKPPSLQFLLENIGSNNEYLGQIREERLSKMLVNEILENEYRWQLYEDEKTEVAMELSDLVFEELIESLIGELGII